MPYEPGTYEFRMFRDSGYTLWASSPAVSVVEFTPSLTVAVKTYYPKNPVVVTYSGTSGFQGSWIGLYPKGSTRYVTYQSINTNTSGSVTFKAPTTAGIYELKVFKDSGTRVLKSFDISIGAGPLVQPTTGITLKAQSVQEGIKLSWNAPSTPVLGYNIYRKTTENYNETLTDFYVKTLEYLDQTVAEGVTYHYIVKPVISQGNEGTPSNEVSSNWQQSQTTIPTQKIVIDLKIDDPYMIVNGQKKEIDPGRGTSPIILNGRTVLPIGSVVEALGGKIGWLGSERKVTIEAMGTVIELWIDQNTAKVNGVTKTIDVPPVVLNGRTMVPLRFVTDNLNSSADWNGETMGIRITTK